jgi:hypothetical protein
VRVSLSSRHSWFVPMRAFVVLGSGLVVAALAIGAALASPSTKIFTAGIQQTGQTTYLFVLANHPSSSQTLGSANVVVPSGVTGVSVPPFANAPPGKTWGSTLQDGIIELRAANAGSALAPGEQVTVTITATAACGSYDWATFARQSNNFLGVGNDFFGPGGESPVLAGVDVVGPADSFEFATIGSPQVVGTPFAITVTAKDECGNVAIYYGGTPALSGLLAAGSSLEPTYPVLSFTNGVASGNVTAVKSQLGAELTAADGSATGTSNEFDVYRRVCTSSDTACTASDEHGTTHLSAPPPPPSGSMALGFADGTTFTCAGTKTALGSFGIIVPEGYTQPIEITGTWPIGPGDGNPTLCLSKDDGKTFFALSRCGRTPVAPCELSRTRTPTSITVAFLIAPDDPWAGIG